ncbi:MAG: metallophosphoesterase [Syntrophobacteraceae bacterium]
MSRGKKRIFISDIHMGDERSWSAQHSYVWFRNNVSLFADFLKGLLQAPDVSEVIILGDLFDQWFIPANYSPIPRLETICASKVYAPVIAVLKALAASADVKLAYVPGNHDMALSPAGIEDTRQFLQSFFSGIDFICDQTIPLGTYKSGTLVAEHGNRYCLFNAPDSASNSGACFLPLGYFISRLDAYRVCREGSPCSVFDIFINLARQYLEGNTHFVEDVFFATARDCGLAQGILDVSGLPGYGEKISVSDIATRFRLIADNWGQIAGTKDIDAFTAAKDDTFGLFTAAQSVYFHPAPESRVVIFGHTHRADMQRDFENPGNPNYIVDPDSTPCRTIYANSGAWIDGATFGCTYVETSEDADRLYVSVKAYPDNNVINGWKGFVSL